MMLLLENVTIMYFAVFLLEEMMDNPPLDVTYYIRGKRTGRSELPVNAKFKDGFSYNK
jgi:hypothetical protein